MLVKWINNLRRMTGMEEDAPIEGPEPPRQEVLLEEIRDLLKTK